MMNMQIMVKTQDGKFSGLEQEPQALNNNTGMEIFHIRERHGPTYAAG
jgi:hypothetical protein